MNSDMSVYLAADHRCPNGLLIPAGTPGVVIGAGTAEDPRPGQLNVAFPGYDYTWIEEAALVDHRAGGPQQAG